MPYRQIPGTDLTVSLLGFGNFPFGTNWWGTFTDEEGITLQNQAFDRGVTFFDTAPTYGNGRSEKLLAQTIKYAGRDNLVLSTKFGYDIYSDPGEERSHREKKQDFSERFIRLDLENSLQRLGVDCIDLYQAHNIRLPHFTDELAAAIEKLQAEGKIRHWGAALGPAIGWREEGHRAFTDYDAATVQTVFNMYEQDPGRELCEIAERRGLGGVIARVPTNSGILDEEFKSADHQFPEWDHRKFRDRHWLIYGLKKNDILRPYAQELGLSLRQLAAKWLASQPALVSLEPNILSLEDVEQFAACCEGKPLSDDLLTTIDDLYARDFDLGDEAHPCNLKSSTAEGGEVRSGYIAPALV